MAIEHKQSVDADDHYRLADQIGHILRCASQRHTQIFSKLMVDGLTPTRFAALVMLHDHKEGLSQNQLGRLSAMDIATIKGVVDKLSALGLVSVNQDPKDSRRNLINLTHKGETVLAEAIPAGTTISEATLEPLSANESKQLIKLLRKIT